MITTMNELTSRERKQTSREGRQLSESQPFATSEATLDGSPSVVLPPPAPPPPPPPPPPALEATAIPAYYGERYRPDLPDFQGVDNRKNLITEKNLLEGARKLKSVDRKVDLPCLRQKFTEEFADVYNKHGIPIVHAVKHLRDEVISVHIRTLDMSGIELLTDALFLWINEVGLKFDHLETLNLNGCVHLSDAGIQWMTKSMPNVNKVLLNGCRKLTNDSLIAIMGKMISSKTSNNPTIELMGAKVTMVPHEIERLELSLNLRGCSLVTPTNNQLAMYGFRCFQELQLEEFPVYKMLVVCTPEFPFSLSRLLSGDRLTGRTAPITYRKLTDIFTHEWNIFEVEAESMEQDVLLTPGTVCVLPFLCKKIEPQLQDKLNHVAHSLLNKCPNIALTPIALVTESSDDEEQLKTMATRVSADMAESIKKIYFTLSSTLLNLTSKRWKVEGMDFQTQNEMAVLASNLEKIGTASSYVTQCTLVHLDAEKMTLDNQKLADTLNSAVQLVNEHLLPLHQKFQKEFLSLANNFPTCSMSPFSSVLTDVKNRSLLVKILEIISWKGRCIFFPELRLKPFISDLDEFSRLLCILRVPPSVTGRMGISETGCIGEGVPCWRHTELTGAIVQCCPNLELQPEEVIGLFEKKNLLLRLPCERSEAHDEMVIYVLPQHLPEEPHVPLSHFWPNKKNSTSEGRDFQVDRFYCLEQGKTNSLVPALLRHCSKISQFTLLWKRGALIRLGAIDCLLELCQRFDGSGNVMAEEWYIGVRGPEPLSTQAERAVWSTLNMYTAITDYVLHKQRIWAMASIPCKSCSPNQDHHAILKDKQAFAVSVMSAKSTYDLALSCQGKCASQALQKKAKKKRFTIKELLGPEYKTIVHRHDAQALMRDPETLNYQSFTKCFQCQRCCEHSVWCHADPGSNPKTSRHCGCEGTTTLCPQCGMCNACTSFLSRIEQTLRPSVCPKDMFDANASTKVNGNLISATGAVNSVAFDNLDLCPTSFSSFSFMLLRCSPSFCVKFKSKGELLFHLFVTKGLLKMRTSLPGEEKSSGDRELESKYIDAAVLGDTINFKVYYPCVGKKYKMEEGVRLEMSINGVTVVAMDNVPVDLQAEMQSGAFILSTPSLQAHSQKQTDFSSPWSSECNLLLYENFDETDRASSLSLCTVSTVLDEEILIVPAVYGDIGLTKPGDAEQIRVAKTSNLLHPVGTTLRVNGVVTTAVDVFVLPPSDGKGSLRKPVVQSCSYEEGPLRQVIDKYGNQVAPLECFAHDERRVFAINPYIYSCLFNRDAILPSSASLQCEFAQAMAAINDAVFFESTVDFIGRAFVYLPKLISSLDMSYPARHMASDRHDNKRMHPLCYIRDNISEQLQVPPPNKQVRDSAIYWQLHLLDAPGIPMPSGTFIRHWRFLHIAWLSVLAMNPEIDITECYELAKIKTLDDEEACSSSPIQIKKWLHRHIQLELQTKMLSLKSVVSFLQALSPKYVSTASQEILATIKENLSSSGLVTASGAGPDMDESWAEMFPSQLICKAHAASYKVSHHLTAIDTAVFKPYSSHIRSIQFSANRITELPEDFFVCLPNLFDLQLSKNCLKYLPSVAGRCDKLKYLNLQGNQLADLPSDFDDLKSLIRLDISGNHLPRIPPIIIKVTSLQKLFASDLFLTELPEDIGNLSNLEVLHVGSCCLQRLPDSIVKLNKLRDLILNGVPWIRQGGALRNTGFIGYESFLAKIGNVVERAIHLAPKEWLKDSSDPKRAFFDHFDTNQDGMLDETEIGALNAHIFGMFPRIGYLGEGYNENEPDQNVSGFPPEIFELKELKFLSLQHQGIQAVPKEIEQLEKLESIVLSLNPFLTTLPGELGSLPLKRLPLDECPSLRTPPIEIRAKGFQAICGYLKRLQTGSVQCKRTKLMLVGLGGAGKTSLMRSLLSEEGRAVLAPGEAITDGIDITNWTVSKDNGDKVSFSVWDFAGQTVYYNTHQFFLSNRAVYLLVWNVRLGYEHAGLDFWLSSISVHAPKAPIFIVGTHVDQVSRGELPTADLSEMYPQIRGFFYISSHTGQGVSKLSEALVTTALHEPYMGESIPQVWLKLERAIISKRSSGSVSVIPYSELETMATVAGIFNKTELSQAVQFLHELGALQHFNNEFLKDRVVIDPQWIVDVMSCVVSVKDSPIKEGKFYHSDMQHVWSEYPHNLHPWLLRLTEVFDLTFPLPDQEMNLVPCLLPDTQPQFEWPDVDHESGRREAKMIYKFAYLPPGLFNRAQVRLYEFCDSSVIWKRGSLLRKNQHLAVILQTRESDLLVKVQGPRPENIIFMVHEVFETLIAESFKGVSYDYLLPCPDCVTAFVKTQFLFSASTIRRATEMKAPFLQCTKYFHTVTLSDLHALMPPDNSHEYDMQLVTAVHGLSQLKRDLCDDIFVSYCSKDLIENQESPTVDPRKIYQDLSDSGYKCFFHGSESAVSLEETSVALRDATVFMALISDAYVKDEKCNNLFTYARVTLNKTLLLVVVGAGSNWQRSKLGLLLSDEVFVSMQNKARYPHKIQELLKSVDAKKKADELSRRGKTSYPPCFISYCWKNSHEAVSKGTKSTQCALGASDPRSVSKFLESKGISCWIDVERVGKQGLFEDIAEGLKQARIVVSCVSDEYASSTNCVMEFRFASTVLKVPTVLATVGTKNGWRNSELGMLAIKNPLPEINLQDENPNSLEKLLQVVKAHMPEDKDSDEKEATQSKTDKDTSNESQKNASFEELYELAQRKFIHQISRYADSSGELYPRLLVVDFKTLQNTESAKKDGEEEIRKEKPPLHKRSSSVLSTHPDFSLSKRSLMFKVLCEHEQGWHHYTDPLEAPDDFGETHLAKFSPYLARVTAILKHSKNLPLNCMASQEGSGFLKWLEELPQARLSEFGSVYQDFRRQVIKADKQQAQGSLARCHLPSGKTIWLCPEHQKLTRVTILTNDILLDVDPTLTRSVVEETMLQHVYEPSNKTQFKKYAKYWPDQGVDKDTFKIRSQGGTTDLVRKDRESADETATSGIINDGTTHKGLVPNSQNAPTQQLTPSSRKDSFDQFKKASEPVNEVAESQSLTESDVICLNDVEPVQAPHPTHGAKKKTDVFVKQYNGVKGKTETSFQHVTVNNSVPDTRQKTTNKVKQHKTNEKLVKHTMNSKYKPSTDTDRSENRAEKEAETDIDTLSLDEGTEVDPLTTDRIADAMQYRRARAKFRAAAAAVIVSSKLENHNKTSVCHIL